MRVAVVSLLAVVSIAVYTAAWSEPAKPTAPTDADAVVTQLAAKLKSDDTKGLFEVLMVHVPVEHADKFGVTGVEMFEKIRAQGKASLGKHLGEVEVASRQSIGKSYHRYVVVDRHQNGGMVWSFNLYRGPTGWLVLNMQCSDKFEQFYVTDPPKN